ncbi:MAG: 50S ribosomal protein L18 [Candidatus Niyogibacteria bacterium CG10_big_fil_rev_8_21_14_0_10_46_36]|uniref:Large ribosomal subunit protein uL18 n=1 Tax=Candidatus Niyogibacteria bacterium CG10_big_fil_rev_8_21_14_0_10_46_36 TaxID=1974726 RepID=A0A2H0TDX9_9BACT|nr:MAG: 50S ribosomal protein L18 [Candidatus Niyogibacteria bacterium CG10_big_fil_rev_8_21_14_0_10_46_36]
MKTAKELQKKKEGIVRRKRRVRARIHGTRVRPRLSVFHSNKHTYAQLIDDVSGMTIMGVGDAKKGAKKAAKTTKTQTAHELGKKLGEAAVKKGIRRAVFDRSHYKYQGRTKAIAEGAREAGLVL